MGRDASDTLGPVPTVWGATYAMNDGGGTQVAEWVRALALNGDRTFPAGFDSHCGRL